MVSSLKYVFTIWPYSKLFFECWDSALLKLFRKFAFESKGRKKRVHEVRMMVLVFNLSIFSDSAPGK